MKKLLFVPVLLIAFGAFAQKAETPKKAEPSKEDLAKMKP